MGKSKELYHDSHPTTEKEYFCWMTEQQWQEYLLQRKQEIIAKNGGGVQSTIEFNELKKRLDNGINSKH